jgi:hypothetical protein
MNISVGSTLRYSLKKDHFLFISPLIDPLGVAASFGLEKKFEYDFKKEKNTKTENIFENKAPSINLETSSSNANAAISTINLDTIIPSSSSAASPNTVPAIPLVSSENAVNLTNPSLNTTEKNSSSNLLQTISLEPEITQQQEILPQISVEFREKRSDENLFQSQFLRSEGVSNYVDTGRIKWAEPAISVCTTLHLIGPFDSSRPIFFRPYDDLMNQEAKQLLQGILAISNSGSTSLMPFFQDKAPTRLEFIIQLSSVLQTLGIRKEYKTLDFSAYQDWIDIGIFDQFELNPYIKILGYGGHQYCLNPNSAITRAEACLLIQKTIMGIH